MVFSGLGARKQPLESLDIGFEQMNFFILTPTNTTPGAAMEISSTL